MSKKTYDILLIILIIAAVLVGFLFAWSFFDYFTGSRGETPPPTAVPPPTAGDPWEKIQASGVMVVGTSADYPPFAYYNDTYQVDGFDIALIREIGQVLGVQVEIRDMAFDGLPGAIQLGQIDAAIAAISTTPERDAMLDFSNVYYVSTDAAIANQNATIAQITNVTEMASYRVGVQRGTVYERWLETALVETGIMPDSNLIRYQLADHIVADVKQNRIDLGVMDLLPAETAVATGGLKMVGKGLNQQLYAIAMFNGAAALQSRLNNALLQLSNSGRLNALIQQYLGVPPDQILPTPTPPPTTPTPLPTATAVPCINSMTFVEDLNLDDDNMQSPPPIPPGQPFRKWWRIKNSGTCTWDSSYSLVYVGGNSPHSQMGGQPTPIQGTVISGQTYDIYVDFVAPLTPGTYQSFWSMSSPTGETFGDRIWAGVVVPSPATPTPIATQTPNPGITFTADRTQIKEGECVTFNWNVAGASAVYFYKQGDPWESNQVPPTGTQSDCPGSTITYELRVTWPDGSSEVRQITVYVEEPTDSPVIYRFVVSPPGQINLGQCVNLDWWVEGTISDVTIMRDNTAIWPNAPVAGNMQDCPPAVGQVVYTITATGPGGSSRQQETITVVQPPNPTATPMPNTPTAVPPTPTVAPPLIYSFSVQPEQIEAGQCVNGSWSVGGGATYARLLRNGSVILDNAPFTGSGTDCLNEGGTYVYRLEASGSQGEQVTEERTVIVNNSPATPPIAGTNWRLVGYNDGSGVIIAIIDGTEVTANFTNDGRVNGSASCNTYDGLYTADGSSITVHDIAVGRTICTDPPGIMEQETQYLEMLQRAATYEISGEQMVMKDAEGQIVLQLETFAQATPFDG